MIEKIISFSVKNKLIIGLLVVALIISGVISMNKLPIDAVPDITNNQVQIVTSSSSLAPQEVEQFITFPIEMQMANIPEVVEIRSISRFGLSVVTVVFEEDVPIMKARQFVKEQIDLAQAEIPTEMGVPEMMPITTGLGEIYQYTLQVDSAYQDVYDPMELRTIQDWIVKRQLMGIKGIIEVSSFGGYLKQYEISIDPFKLKGQNVTISEVFEALETNNENSGGSYIEKGANAYYIRTEGLIETKADIENIVVKRNGDVPIFIRNLGTVQYGHPPRFGAMTMDGKGEAVGGITLMLKGANSSEAIENVHQRVLEVQKSLPPGIRIEPYLDRSVLVGKAIGTVSKNLIEGGLIVIFVLILLLGNLRAGLIVASVIPLSLLFAFILMNYFGVSANLMSLGAIDFGIVIDGAVIIVEGVLHLIFISYVGKKLTQQEMDGVIIKTSSNIIGSAAFGVLIIIVVFVPIMTLTGIEGKMFTPMAKTVSFAILGALLLSITYVPMMVALVLKKDIKAHRTFADRIMDAIKRMYKPVIERVLNFPRVIIGLSLVMLTSIVFLFNSMGAEFVPTLDEGDLAMQVTIEPGSSLTEMVRTTTEAERILKSNFPEVLHVVSKIGTAEVPTDPMAVEDADVMILLKPREEWQSAHSREELANLMKQKLTQIDWAQFDFTQPIQLRFNELISGSKTDVAIKLFGENMTELATKGREIEKIIQSIPGAGDVKMEQTEGLPQLMVKYDREKLAIHHLDISDLNKVIRTAYAGENAGIVYEGERRFDLTVRLDEAFRKNVDLTKLFINKPSGDLVPISELAELRIEEGPMLISRENAKRRIAVGVNVRNRDIASFVEEVQKKIEKNVKLEPGYFIKYGGQFENLTAAKKRLSIAVPVALGLIFLLLFFAFKSFKYGLMIFTTVPLSAVGGVIALVLRGMPFSISAGVGFIALFGVAVLNGIVLISYFNKLKSEGLLDAREIVIQGSLTRLRPVLMTAAVASLGFLPMAISTSSGAEVQKPLATVVIGGLITATLLTLIVLPVIYYLSEKRGMKMRKITTTLVMCAFTIPFGFGQELTQQAAVDSTIANNKQLSNSLLSIDQAMLNKKSVFSAGNTEVNLQRGQMNSIAMDNYLQINQMIGNPLLWSSQSKEAEARIETATAVHNNAVKSVVLSTKLLWTESVAIANSIQLYEAQIALMDVYLKQMESKLELGEISDVDYGLAIVYQSELQSNLSSLKVQLSEMKAQLKTVTGITSNFTLLAQVDSIDVKAVNQLIMSELNQDLLRPEESSIVAANFMEKSAKFQFFPEISAGYFRQSIDHEKNFQGAMVGLTIPVFNRGQFNSLKQAQLMTETMENNRDYQESVYTNEFMKAKERLTNFFDIYLNYGSTWSKQSAFLSNSADVEFNSGEIDYYRYLQAKSKSLELQLKSIEISKEIHQSIAQVEFYSSVL